MLERFYQSLQVRNLSLQPFLYCTSVHWPLFFNVSEQFWHKNDEDFVKCNLQRDKEYKAFVIDSPPWEAIKVAKHSFDMVILTYRPYLPYLPYLPVHVIESHQKAD